MAQEGGQRDRADELRAWLIASGEPDGAEQAERDRYEALWGDRERAESPSEGRAD